MNKSKYFFPVVLAVVSAAMIFLYSENMSEITEHNNSSYIPSYIQIKDFNNLTDGDLRSLPGLTATLG